MVNELVGAGYGGPYDAASVINADARTSGGSVICAGFAGAAPTAPGTTLVAIGGWDSDPGTIAARFGILAQQLGANMQVFGYTQTGSGSYQPSDTCAPEAALIRMLRTLRQQVVLAGHSLGGVLAFDAAARGGRPHSTARPIHTQSYRANVWQPWLTNSANYLLNRGVNLAIVANPEDGAAILNNPDALSAIAGWVSSWFR